MNLVYQLAKSADGLSPFIQHAMKKSLKQKNHEALKDLVAHQQQLLSEIARIATDSLYRAPVKPGEAAPKYPLIKI